MAARSSLTVVSGTTITSAWGNSVRDHLVPRTTSNDVAAEGQMAVNTSTDQVVFHNGTSAVEFARYGSLGSITTTCTQSFNVAISNAYQYYDRLFLRVFADIELIFGANGSTGALITVSTNLPAPSKVVNAGSFTYTVAGARFYQGSVIMDTSSRLTFRCHNEVNQMGIAPSFAIISGDSMTINLSYLAAA